MFDDENGRGGGDEPPGSGGRRDPGEDTVVEILGFDDEDPSGAGAQAAAEPESAPSVGERRLAHELEAQKERYLRLRADFDNFRKRAERERAEVERYALVEPLRSLLPVVDNLERALAAAAPVSGAEDLKRGVEMTLRQLEETLRRFGLAAVPALGERFDPSVHEAVMHEESEDVTSPTVSAELQRGFRLNDRLLRPAMVKVAVPREAGNPGADDPSDA